MPQVVIYNDPSSGEKDADIQAMISPLQQQVEEFAKFWGRGCDLSFVDSGSKPPSGVWLISLLANSDQAGALGYHDLTPDGLPLGKVFAATDRQYGEIVSVTLSHELLEMLGDPYINQAAQGPDGKFYAYEACDAVEADALAYDIAGVKVSNFVTEAWFGNGAGPFDCMGKLSKALELAPGGYIGVFDPSSGQGWTQVTAAHEPAKLAARVVAAIPRVGSRRERRQRFAQGGPRVHSTYQTA